jgi:chorismate synthase
MGSGFGVLFRITTFGESHGQGLGVVIDGCPAQLALDVDAIQRELDRRRPGQSRLVTQRKEDDKVEILSGVLDGVTLGTPIAMLIRNADARSKDYEGVARAYRPSHADYTYDAKYGIRAVAGGGRASARETAGRVAAGAVAQQLLARHGIAIVAWVDEVSGIKATVDEATITRDAVEINDIRCPDAPVAQTMIDCIERARKDGNSVGGVILHRRLSSDAAVDLSEQRSRDMNNIDSPEVDRRSKSGSITQRPTSNCDENRVPPCSPGQQCAREPLDRCERFRLLTIRKQKTLSRKGE